MADELVVGEGARGLSQVERVVDTFVAPSKTFMDILRSSSWWLPFVLMVLSSVLTAATVDKKVGFDRVYQNMISQSPKTQDRLNSMEPAQKAQTMKVGALSMKATSYGAPLLLAIILTIYSLMLWAAFNFGLGAQTTFSQVMAVTWYAALPYLVLAVVTFLTLQFGNNGENYDVKNPVGTNIGYYLTDAPPMLKAALSSIDLIKLWSVVLQVIGMAIIARKTIMQSAVVVGIFWVLGVLAGTAGAAFS